MKLALIPAGKFMMGSPKEKSEQPQHEVTITKPFYMSVTTVTQSQFEAEMGKVHSYHYFFKGPQNPVEQVPWGDAVKFCKKLSAKTGKQVRLPTEAEWEYACRAGTTTRFFFGDDDTHLGDYAWYRGNTGGTIQGRRNIGAETHPVGQKKPNPWGLYDMYGNVWQWCSDYYADSYENAKNVDPQGPDHGNSRVLRGGDLNHDSNRCNSTNRYQLGAENQQHFSGFRVVVDLP